MNKKPRLRLFIVNSMGWRIWECVCGATASGFGHTPKEAYDDWFKRVRKNAADMGIV